MNATSTTTVTPYLDKAIAALEAAADEADSQADGCVACIRTLSGWCPGHEEQRARHDEIEPVVMRLWAAGSDREARVIIAGVPSLAGLVDEDEKAAAA